MAINFLVGLAAQLGANAFLTTVILCLVSLYTSKALKHFGGLRIFSYKLKRLEFLEPQPFGAFILKFPIRPH
jgi:hypothetical protein